MCIISTAQHANPKVKGQRLFFLPIFIRSSNFAKTKSVFVGLGSVIAVGLAVVTWDAIARLGITLSALVIDMMMICCNR